MYQIGSLGFIAHPNCASRSIRGALEKRGAVKYGHHHRYDEKIIAQCEHTFCIIRNPFDLMFSWYYRTQNGPHAPGVLPFTDWIAFALYGPEPRHFEGPYDKLYYAFHLCDLVCKFENLQRDFDQVMRAAGLKPIGLRQIGQTARKPVEPFAYRAAYDKEARRIIETEYAEQLEMGNYEF